MAVSQTHSFLFSPSQHLPLPEFIFQGFIICFFLVICCFIIKHSQISSLNHSLLLSLTFLWLTGLRGVVLAWETPLGCVSKMAHSQAGEAGCQLRAQPHSCHCSCHHFFPLTIQVMGTKFKGSGIIFSLNNKSSKRCVTIFNLPVFPVSLMVEHLSFLTANSQQLEQSFRFSKVCLIIVPVIFHLSTHFCPVPHI